MLFNPVRRAYSLIVAGVAVVAATGCGSSGNGAATAGTGPAGHGTAPTVQRDPAIAKLVPKAVAQRGTLTVAVDPNYAPLEFFGSGSNDIRGMDPDFTKALAGLMGLKVKLVNITFDAIIPGLQAKRFDVGISSFTDTKEREQTVDFVTYFNAGTSLFVRSADGPAVQGLADLCGHVVAVAKGTNQQQDAARQSKRCSAAGKKPVTLRVFPDQAGANLAMSSGRAEVGLADSPVVDYQVLISHGGMKVVGTTYGTAPYGIAIPKGTGLAPALQAAVDKLMASGAYGRILRRWGLLSGAIDKAEINAAKI